MRVSPDRNFDSIVERETIPAIYRYGYCCEKFGLGVLELSGVYEGEMCDEQ